MWLDVLRQPPVRKESSVEVSYFVGQEYRGRGIAAASLDRGKRFASQELEADIVIAKVLESNVASRALLEKKGFSVLRNTMAASGPSKGEQILVYGF